MAIMTFLLSEYANEDIDVLKTIRMILIHDIVEIDAGDTYAYDAAGNATKAEREQQAAKRLFGLLPKEQELHFRRLWEEFEAGSTPEARFCAALDRIQPLTLNYCKGGLSWQRHGIKCSQVQQRMASIGDSSAVLGDYASELIRRGVENGWLKAE